MKTPSRIPAANTFEFVEILADKSAWSRSLKGIVGIGYYANKRDGWLRIACAHPDLDGVSTITLATKEFRVLDTNKQSDAALIAAFLLLHPEVAEWANSATVNWGK
jgi:hypothetical protein